MIPGYHHLMWGQSHFQESLTRLLMMGGHYRGAKAIEHRDPDRLVGRQIQDVSAALFWAQNIFCPKSMSVSNSPRFTFSLCFSGSWPKSTQWLITRYSQHLHTPCYIWFLWEVEFLPLPHLSPWPFQSQALLPEMSCLPDSCCPVPLGCWLLWPSIFQCDTEMWPKGSHPFLRTSPFLSLLGLP